MPLDSYAYGPERFAELLLRKFVPERTERESGVMIDFLRNHIDEYDEVHFTVRVGTGAPPDPTHLAGVQRAAVFSSKKRIDMLLRAGAQWTIVEAKERVTPSALGQILAYRQLWLEGFPDATEPRLVVIGRRADDETTRILQSHGVDVLLFPGGAGPSADGAVSA